MQQKAYALALELVAAVERMPRGHRFTLGDRLVGLVYDLNELLVEARYTKERAGLLRKANLLLERLRLMLKLASDLRLASLEASRDLSRLLEETGRMVGAWDKSPRGTDQMVVC